MNFFFDINAQESLILKLTPKVKSFILAAAIFLYLAFVFFLFDSISYASFMFMFLPAVVAAGLLGRRKGVVVTLALIGVSGFFLVFQNMTEIDVLVKFLAGSALTVILAYSVGLLRDMYLALMKELRQKEDMKIELERRLSELRKARSHVKTLSGLLPICASCKRIRDDMGYWNQIEEYISQHSEAYFSHGLCPECMEKYYPQSEKFK
jgi:low affinity Fe/Cu permease